MIHVDKNRVAVPNILMKDNCDPDGEKQKAIQYFEGNMGQKVTFEIYGHNTVKSTLKQLFHNKCAYCESIVTHVSYPHVEHWRPKGGVAGESSHNGYYWLASEWSNLLLACSVCNGASHKGNHFPIARGSSYAFRSNQDLAIERPLLINPCLETNLSLHLSYRKKGGVQGITVEGKKSIEVYGLNRHDLLVERKKFADIVVGQLEDINYFVGELREAVATGRSQASHTKIKRQIKQKVENLKKFCGSDFQYSGMIRYLINAYRQANMQDQDLMAAIRNLI